MNISGISTNHEKQQVGFGMALKVIPKNSTQKKALQAFAENPSGAMGSFVAPFPEPVVNPIIAFIGKVVGYLNPSNIIFGFAEHNFNWIQKFKTGAYTFNGFSQIGEDLLARGFKNQGFKVKQTPFRESASGIEKNLKK